MRRVPIHPLTRRAARGRGLARRLCVLAALGGIGLSSDPAEARPTPADCRRSRRTADDRAGHRVVLIGIEPRFACALQTALDPWGLRLVDSDAPSPGSSMPSTSLSAREIAERHGARAVIWLGEDAAGFALWVYDAFSDRSVSRPVPPPPFPSSVSASLALSVKTTLMMVGLGSDAALADEQEAPAALDAGAPLQAALVLPTRPTARWQLGAHGGIQLGPLAGGGQDVRYGLELRWSQAALGLRPWLAIELSAGVPLRVREAALEGRVWDAASTFALGATQPLTDVWAVAISGAAALHVTSLSGTALPVGVNVDDLEANPSLRFGAELQANLGAFALGLRPSFEVWLRGQRYTVERVPVLEHRRRALGLALAVWVPLD